MKYKKPRSIWMAMSFVQIWALGQLDSNSWYAVYAASILIPLEAYCFSKSVFYGSYKKYPATDVFAVVLTIVIILMLFFKPEWYFAMSSYLDTFIPVWLQDAASIGY